MSARIGVLALVCLFSLPAIGARRGRFNNSVQNQVPAQPLTPPQSAHNSDGQGSERPPAETIELPAKPVEQMNDQEYADYIQTLPQAIRHFVEVYAIERPGMRFHPLLYQVAQKRAKYCMTVRGGHPSDLNRQVRSGGYKLPRNIPDNGNELESLWAGAVAEDALEGWRGHGPHKVHVFGTQSPYHTHKYFGVGYYASPPGSRGQWVIITAPPQEQSTDK